MPKLIVESQESFIARCKEDFNTELEKVLTHVPAGGNSTHHVIMALVRLVRVMNTRLVTLENDLIKREHEEARKRNIFADYTEPQQIINACVMSNWDDERKAAKDAAERIRQIQKERNES